MGYLSQYKLNPKYVQLVGIVLAKRLNIQPKSELYGKCIEHLVFLELRAWLSYSRNRNKLSFWRSVNGQEVDFIIGDNSVIEVKATSRVQNKHLKGIKALAEELSLTHKIIISLDDLEFRVNKLLPG